MPTTAQNTFSNQGLVPFMDPEQALSYHVKLPNSATVAKGTIIGEITASPGNYKAYASGSSDGSQIPKAITAYDVVVDSSGNHTIGGGSQGETSLTAPAYFAGTFRTTDLTGLDATAITNSPSWRLISGSTADGILRLG